MNTEALIDTARALVADDKGLLAMDESNPTCNKRFAKLGIPQTAETRRAYREMIATTPDLGECFTGPNATAPRGAANTRTRWKKRLFDTRFSKLTLRKDHDYAMQS